jgi:isochorismate pyruvate lyase
VKSPDQCENILEIRTEIDRLDLEVIRLLGQRFAYVQAASGFKTDEANVRAAERFQAMLEQRRIWATEQLFRDLVNHFIDEELKRWRNPSQVLDDN